MVQFVKPRIGITMGDPTGIGPEVVLKALAARGVRAGLTPLLVGDRGVFETTARRLRLALRFTDASVGAAVPRGTLAVHAVSPLRTAQYRPGRPTRAGGRAAYAAILEAVRLVQSGAADALVTAPICKANLAAVGATATGHTELLAALTRARHVRMMMVGPRLRVALVTTHLALSAVPRALTRPGVRDTITVADAALRTHFGLRRPRLAVTGLNPHAGEGGLFGHEDRRIIAPAVRAARRRGIDARGPLAADSVFPHAAAGAFDAVVCMYHDQGLAPFKLLHFADGVNFTAGLPFVRTSPDHGTAHDIAGRGVADPSSMIAALRLAAELAGAHR
jgi:4-hydroxythreonine-4-phosphate dehydrogenase